MKREENPMQSIPRRGAAAEVIGQGTQAGVSRRNVLIGGGLGMACWRPVAGSRRG